MSFFRFTCLMNSGWGLNNTSREILFRTAKRLAREQDRKIRIKEDGFEGSVETSYESVTLGAISGIRFHGTLDFRLGSSKTSFIVPEKELELPEEPEEEATWLPIGDPARQAEKAWLN